MNRGRVRADLAEWVMNLDAVHKLALIDAMERLAVTIKQQGWKDLTEMMRDHEIPELANRYRQEPAFTRVKDWRVTHVDVGPWALLWETAGSANGFLHGDLCRNERGRNSVPGEGAMSELNNSLNRRWIQAFNERDWTAEADCRSTDYQAHVSGASGPLDGSGWAGFMQSFTTAFPDAQITIDHPSVKATLSQRVGQSTEASEGSFKASQRPGAK
jgi:hypothetical protein